MDTIITTISSFFTGNLSFLSSNLIGGIITWFVSRRYYRRAAQELKQESTELRRLSTLILCSLERAGLVELGRDASGRIMGLTVKLSPSPVVGSASVSAEITAPGRATD